MSVKHSVHITVQYMSAFNRYFCLFLKAIKKKSKIKNMLPYDCFKCIHVQCSLSIQQVLQSELLSNTCMYRHLHTYPLKENIFIINIALT